MYKEALIRNTYQGILANRPRDLTEEELEALEIEQLQIGDQKDEGEVDTHSTVAREGLRTPTKALAPSSILQLGLPPLAGHCLDSPMSLKAQQSSSTNWRHTVCGNTTTPNTLHAQHRSQLLYTPVSLATGGETMTDRVSGIHSFTNNTEAGSVMSWIQDDEDAFYEQLAEEEPPQSPAKNSIRLMVRKHSEEDEECHLGLEDRSYSNSCNTRNSALPRKGGRAGKRKAGSSSNGSQWKDVKKGAGGTSSSSNTNATSTKANNGGGGNKANSGNVSLSGGRFDALRR